LGELKVFLKSAIITQLLAHCKAFRGLKKGQTSSTSPQNSKYLKCSFCWISQLLQLLLKHKQVVLRQTAVVHKLKTELINEI
ncbi:MAG TPA: hypothetical protein DG752_10765, partial [Leeuwenhoekiella sp.]|nr:hypothetical protein [Leeuwenhoekiella sp.]